MGSGRTGAFISDDNGSVEMRCFCLTSSETGGRSLTFLMLGKARCVGELLFSVASFFWLTVEITLLKAEIWPLNPLSKP